MTPQPVAATQPSAPPSIHEAERASGPSGAVLAGTVMDFSAAVARRQAGLDVVVCGEDVAANRRLAGAIETTVGVCQRSDPHRRAGPLALPHFQQDTPPPEGHTFYETANRKARKRS
ncbi:MAG TPA: hypothetical protein VH575_20220 [Gemmataceae bacterium]|jgi:hypothetical protein